MEMKRDIGIIGLGTMGQNLCINMLSKDLSVAAWDIEADETQRLAQTLKNDALTACASLDELLQKVERPRKLILLINAGDPVDEVIAQCLGALSRGDVVIDAGNSHYKDSQRRHQLLQNKDIEFVGLGVSGGAEGARLGPSLMFGGSSTAWKICEESLRTIAANSVYGSCLSNFGEGGAGHFVKMVHNGIEYAEMQLIAEAYDIMCRGFGMDVTEQTSAFDRFNKGPLNSFLTDLTVKILNSDSVEIAEIVDSAGQKGTGRWVVEAGLDLGVPIPTLSASVEARLLSALLERRDKLSQRINSDRKILKPLPIEDIERALIFGKVSAFIQGIDLVQAAKENHQWSLNLLDIPRTWRQGCILRSVFLDRWIEGTEGEETKSLIDVRYFWEQLIDCELSIRSVLGVCTEARIPVPALSASVSWYDSLTSSRLPQSLTQAQRDAFGAHGLYLRNDPTLLVHKEW